MAVRVRYYARGRWWDITIPRPVMDSGNTDAYCETEMDRILEAERNQRIINNPTFLDNLGAFFKRKRKAKL